MSAWVSSARCGVGIALVVALSATSVLARAPAPTAIAYDLANGRVLVARGVDAPRRPASLTKLMTLYVAFEAIEAGEIAADAPVTISPTAAGQPPVKAYLSPGASVPLDELIAAAGVASSNDAAVAVAEAVAGSEAAFVARMNEAAAALGMINTEFKNASGLPAEGQKVTARDLGLLVQAMFARHAERAAVLARPEVRTAGKRLRTTNPLIGGYPGALGLKTGFTCKSGYSLAAMAERDGARIVAIAIGHGSKQERRDGAARLLNAAFAARDAGAPSATPSPTPAPKPAALRVIGPPSAEPEPLPDGVDPAEGAAYAPETSPKPRQAQRAALAVDEPEILATALAPAAVENPAPPPARATCAGGGGGLRGWGVFLGAHAKRGAADKAVRAAAGFGGAAFVTKRKRDKRWAALIHGLGRQSAVRTCLKARQAGRYCVTLSPTSLRHPRARWR